MNHRVSPTTTTPHPAGPSRKVFSFGPFHLDTEIAELRKFGLRIKLREQALQALQLLLEQPGMIVNREQLRQLLWPDQAFGDFDRGIIRVINKVRLALGDTAEKPHYIETIPRRGYRFIAEVTIHEVPAHETLTKPGEAALLSFPVIVGEPSSGIIPGLAPDIQSSPESSLQKNRLRLPRRAYYALALLTVVVATFSSIYVHRQRNVRNTPAAVIPRRSIAVLGFKNLSRNNSDDWLATALSEWMTTDLAAGGQLRTLQAADVARMKMELALTDPDKLTSDDLTRIRKNLHADLVVVGAYASQGEPGNSRIRLDFRLLDTRTGEMVSAFSETGSSAKLFDVVSRSGEAMRAQLGVPSILSADEKAVAAAMPSHWEAALLYSQALAKVSVFDEITARDLLEKTITLEPDFAPAHAALASVWSSLSYDTKAREESKKAFDLSNNLSRPERLKIEADYWQYSSEWDKSIAIYQELFSSYPDNLDYGLDLIDVQVLANRFREGKETIARLRQLPQPLCDDPQIDIAEAKITLHSGESKQAVEAAQRALRKASATGASLLVAQAELAEGWAYVGQDDPNHAIEVLGDAKKRFASAGFEARVASALTALGTAYEFAADFDHAQSSFKEAIDVFHRVGYRKGESTTLFSLGALFVNLGKPSEARVQFEKAQSMAMEIHDEDGIASARSYLGDALTMLAEPIKARKLYQEALDRAQQMSNQGLEAMSIVNMGQASYYEGKLDRAASELDRGIGIYEKLSNKDGIAWGELYRSNVLHDQGRDEEAAAAARRAVAIFEDEPNMEGQVASLSFLAEILLQQNKVSEAQKSIQEARALQNNYKAAQSELALEMAEIKMQAASTDKAQSIEAEKNAQALLNKYTQMDYLLAAFDARFELCKIELKNGKNDIAKGQLKALTKEANDKGMGLIAAKATQLLNKSVSAN